MKSGSSRLLFTWFLLQMKVNPNLVVEVKPNQVPREMRNEIARKLRAQRMQAMPFVLIMNF